MARFAAVVAFEVDVEVEVAFAVGVVVGVVLAVAIVGSATALDMGVEAQQTPMSTVARTVHLRVA